MTNEIIKTRFAPSPTGFLHLGNIRTALFNWLFARSRNGQFLLRIEDTDQSRHGEEYVAALKTDLHWLGLDWDEGPEIGGDHGPYRQSERGEVYNHYFQLLAEQELIYPCFCSQTELAVMRKTQLSAGRPPRYSGLCGRLNQAERQSRIDQGIQPTLRFRVQPSEVIEFHDWVRGPQRFMADDIGDFVIRRADGSAAFFFTNAIDDALMEVSDVLRGDDHLSNTPRQIMLLQALGLRIPRYGHISMVVGHDGAPLSKRTGSMAVSEVREASYFPIAVNNTLARLGHYYPETQFMSLEQLAAHFSLDHLGRAPARFDRTQLDYWQHETISHSSLEELLSWLKPTLELHVPIDDQPAYVSAVRANIMSRQDATNWAKRIYAEQLDYSSEARECITSTSVGFFETAQQCLDETMDFSSYCKRVKEQSGKQGKALFHPLRSALTGQTQGPEMQQIFPLIGMTSARKRLLAAEQHVNSHHHDQASDSE